eukprot:330524_1
MMNLDQTESTIADDLMQYIEEETMNGRQVISFKKDDFLKDFACDASLDGYEDLIHAICNKFKEYNQNKWRQLRHKTASDWHQPRGPRPTLLRHKTCGICAYHEEEAEQKPHPTCAVSAVMKRVTFALSYYCRMTQTLLDCYAPYPHDMKQFMIHLSSDMRNEINDYKPLDLLQDMNHIMQQHSSRIHSLNCQLP